jgi:hypothetical protein
MIKKCALAALDNIKWAWRVDFPLFLTGFGLMAVLAQDLFEELHGITLHGRHPLQTTPG